MVHLQPGYSNHIYTGSTRGLSLFKHLCSNRGWWVCWVSRTKTKPLSVSTSLSRSLCLFSTMLCHLCILRGAWPFVWRMLCLCPSSQPPILTWSFILVFSSTLPFHATVRGSSFDDKMTYEYDLNKKRIWKNLITQQTDWKHLVHLLTLTVLTVLGILAISD